MNYLLPVSRILEFRAVLRIMAVQAGVLGIGQRCFDARVEHVGLAGTVAVFAADAAKLRRSFGVDESAGSAVAGGVALEAEGIESEVFCAQRFQSMRVRTLRMQRTVLHVALGAGSRTGVAIVRGKILEQR